MPRNKRPTHVSDFEMETSLYDADRREYNAISNRAYWAAYLENQERAYWEKKGKKNV